MASVETTLEAALDKQMIFLSHYDRQARFGLVQLNESAILEKRVRSDAGDRFLSSLGVYQNRPMRAEKNLDSALSRKPSSPKYRGKYRGLQSEFRSRPYPNS